MNTQPSGQQPETGITVSDEDAAAYLLYRNWLTPEEFAAGHCEDWKQRLRAKLESQARQCAVVAGYWHSRKQAGKMNAELAAARACVALMDALRRQAE